MRGASRTLIRSTSSPASLAERAPSVDIDESAPPGVKWHLGKSDASNTDGPAAAERPVRTSSNAGRGPCQRRKLNW